MKNFHSIILSQDATSVFLIGRDGSNNGALCLVSASTLNSADWTILTSTKTISLAYIGLTSGTNELVFSIYESSKLKLAKIDETSGSASFAWVNEFGYSGYGGITSVQDKLAYDSSTQEIYHMAYMSNDIIIFMAINPQTGSLKHGVYYLNTLTSIETIGITIKDRVYLMAQTSSQNYIFPYDTGTNTFSSTYDNVTRFKGVFVAMLENFFLSGGMNTNNNCAIFK